MQLLAEFKRMGASVMYASLNRIVLATNKTSKEDAQAYIEHVLRSIQYVFGYIVSNYG